MNKANEKFKCNQLDANCFELEQGDCFEKQCDYCKAYFFLKKEASTYEPFNPCGLNKLPHILYDAITKAMVHFKKSPSEGQ